jgi:hypothetical protein
MHYYFLVLVGLTFFVFFREDILKFYKRFEKHNLFFVCLLLIAFAYEMLSHEIEIDKLIKLFEYDIQKLRHLVFNVFKKLIDYQDLELLTDFIFKLIVLSFFVFYPYRYEKNHPKIVYASQIFSVNVIYAFLSLVFCMFCAKFGI